MKKIKSLKTLTTLGAISAITPIITTACNDKDSQPTPVDKIDINSFDWSNTGNYNSAMTTIQFIDEFKKNNVAGQNNIPADIYDHINFDISGALASWTITLTAKDTSTKYFGTKQIDINAKINVVSLNWISTGDYSIDMAKDHILNVFKQNNPSGQHGLPDDVYENVDVTNDGESKWTISITAKDTSTTYIGQDNISISASGSITYDGKKYILADNLDINCFCGTGGLTIPTKDNGNLIVDFHSKITEIIFPPNITTKHINDFFLFNFDNLKSIDLSNLNSVTSIGNRFMFSCGSLEEVNLDGLYNVKEIGFSFMYGCSGLRTFDTKNLSNVE